MERNEGQLLLQKSYWSELVLIAISVTRDDNGFSTLTKARHTGTDLNSKQKNAAGWQTVQPDFKKNQR